jgi:protein phosphatase PTC7
MIKKDSSICEDAFFLLNNAAGVADGVGGWSEFGITSSLFSQALMKNCSHIFTQSFKHIDPHLVLSQAYERTTFAGSATALICALNDSELTFANIGDSRFLLIRFNDKDEPYIAQQSNVQRHVFNTPFQLANIPSSKEIQCRLQENFISANKLAKMLSKYESLEFYKDTPEAAELYKFNVQEDDLVVLATDGLFDNLFLEEILGSIKKIIGTRIRNQVPPKEIADIIADCAYKQSKSFNENSPFSEELREHKAQLQMVILFWYSREGKRMI